jgi:predicted nucleotidyltransferase
MLTKLMPAARVKTLAILLLNASEEIHLREIARRAGVPLQAAQREVALLEEIALVKRQQRGRQVFVIVQTDHPLFEDLRSLLLKSDGLAVPIRQALESIDGVRAVAIYGSVAAGTDSGLSDIDLLIVGSPDEIEIHETVSSLELDLGRPVNYTLISVDELESRLEQHDPFLERILSGDLIRVIGDPHAL